MNDSFKNLPDDVIFQIAINESLDNIARLCQTSNRFNNIICNNNNFWKHKYIHDFGEPTINILNWKDAYQNYGIVVAFGGGRYGQLGLGDMDDVSIPIEIPNIRARNVSSGNRHTIIIDTNYNVWGFGANMNGQLGLGDKKTNRIK